MSAKCEQWILNPTINPETGRKIKLGGPTFKKLEKKCSPKPSPLRKSPKRISSKSPLRKSSSKSIRCGDSHQKLMENIFRLLVIADEEKREFRLVFSDKHIISDDVIKTFTIKAPSMHKFAEMFAKILNIYTRQKLNFPNQSQDFFEKKCFIFKLSLIKKRVKSN